LIIDGSTADLLGGQIIPQGSFPTLHFMPVLTPNVANTLSAPALLPRLNPNNARNYDGTQDVELTVEGVDGLKMLVRAGTTVTLVDGRQYGPGHSGFVTLSLNQVHHDDVPMPIPDGAAPPFAWTLQPGGATFDQPVEIAYPNMSGLPPGALSNFLSFNHDTNRFEIIGTGRVSTDGSTIVSDPGVGITKAGWGCNCPPYSVTGDCCSGCGGVCCDVGCCHGECGCGGYCCASGCCPYPCFQCLNRGQLSGGNITINPDPACLGQTITFTASGVSDNGGSKREDCGVYNIPAVSPSYSWTITKPGGGAVSGGGPIATIVADEGGQYHGTFFVSANRQCPPAPRQIAALIEVGPKIEEATEWLVVHDPVFERDHCRPSSIPRCKQAELMKNEAVVKVKKPENESGCNFTVRLVEVDAVFNDIIVEGRREDVGDIAEFHFCTTSSGNCMNEGARTDANGGVYVENVLLTEGITGALGNPIVGPDYRFELVVNGTVKESRDVTINPLIHDLSFLPDILATPPVKLDPYKDLNRIGPPMQSTEPVGYNQGEFFGLLIRYELYENVQYPPKFLFYNDPDVPSWGGDQGIASQYELSFDLELGDVLWSGGTDQKEIKWEGFTSNTFVIDQSGYREQAAHVFLEGGEAELTENYDIGDGVIQSTRGVGPRYVVKEGNYVNEFKLKRQGDLTQEQRVIVPFEVQYDIP
jgi:hypothetical protein